MIPSIFQTPIYEWVQNGTGNAIVQDRGRMTPEQFPAVGDRFRHGSQTFEVIHVTRFYSHMSARNVPRFEASHYEQTVATFVRAAPRVWHTAKYPEGYQFAFRRITDHGKA